MITSQQSWMEKLPLQESTEEFMSVWGQSSVKVTDGRCQRQLPDDVAVEVTAKVCDLLHDCSISLGGDNLNGDMEELKANQRPAMFVFAAGNVSKPRHELRQLGTLRMTVKRDS